MSLLKGNTKIGAMSLMCFNVNYAATMLKILKVHHKRNKTVVLLLCGQTGNESGISRSVSGNCIVCGEQNIKRC